jgi:hypothetical protein
MASAAGTGIVAAQPERSADADPSFPAAGTFLRNAVTGGFLRRWKSFSSKELEDSFATQRSREDIAVLSRKWAASQGEKYIGIAHLSL